MNSMTSSSVSAAAGWEGLGGVRSFSDGGNRAQKQRCPVGEMDCNSRVWTSGSLPIPSNRVTVADRRPRGDFGTRLSRHEWSVNGPALASASVGGCSATIKSRRGVRSVQSYGELGFQVSGLVVECQSTSAFTESEFYSKNGACRAHPFSQGSWRGTQLLVSPVWTSRTNGRRGPRECSRLSKSSAGGIGRSRVLALKNSRDYENSVEGFSSSTKLSDFTNISCKCRASFVRSATLNRSPDTRPDEQHKSETSVATTSEDSIFPEEIHHPGVVFEGVGKCGFVSFYKHIRDQYETMTTSRQVDYQPEPETTITTSTQVGDHSEPETTITTSSSWRTLVWLLGPLVLTASVFLPPLYIRRIFGRLLQDSLTTDFVILIFTEILFYIGAALFLYITHQFRSRVKPVSTEQNSTISLPLGYRVSAIVSVVVGLLLPVATFLMVWPWTCPAAAAALAPCFVGFLVQLCLERIAIFTRSPVWAIIPIIFQVYRLHQLNRAAQLISGLMYSLKGVEATAETMAISGSLQTILIVLKFLGFVSLWSLGAFLSHQAPTQRPPSTYTASVP